MVVWRNPIFIHRAVIYPARRLVIIGRVCHVEGAAICFPVTILIVPLTVFRLKDT